MSPTLPVIEKWKKIPTLVTSQIETLFDSVRENSDVTPLKNDLWGPGPKYNI